MRVVCRALGSVALLLTCALAGCRHRTAAPPPPVAAAPPITPSSITVITPLPSVPPGSQPNVQQAQPQPTPVAPAPQPVKRKRRLRKKPAATPSSQTAQTAAPAPASAVPVSAEASANAPPPPSVSSTASEASPSLGELSAGTTITSTERSRMLKEIQQQEERLAKVKESATPDARVMQMQIRSFLSKARQAVAENDVDGARTLNTKARLLLDELESE